MDQIDRVLNAPMGENDADAKTIREYLVFLGREVWCVGEGFSGKRPFGNSSWEYEIYNALAENNLIEAQYHTYDDGDRELGEFNREEADSLIARCFERLAVPQQEGTPK